MENVRASASGHSSGQSALAPDRLLQLGMAFWASKTLLSAVELGVFTQLASGPRDAAELSEALGLHPRAALDFLDALVALNLLDRKPRTTAMRLTRTCSSTRPSPAM